MDRRKPLSIGLKKLAAKRKISQAEIARRCDIGGRTFGGYCSGKREPDLETLLRICSRMGVTPNDLLLDADGDNERDTLMQRLTGVLSLMGTSDLKAALAAFEAIAATREAETINQE